MKRKATRTHPAMESSSVVSDGVASASNTNRRGLTTAKPAKGKMSSLTFFSRHILLTVTAQMHPENGSSLSMDAELCLAPDLSAFHEICPLLRFRHEHSNVLFVSTCGSRVGQPPFPERQ